MEKNSKFLFLINGVLKNVSKNLQKRVSMKIIETNGITYLEIIHGTEMMMPNGQSCILS